MPAYSLSLRQTAAQTSRVDNDITFTLGSSKECGTYITGDHYAVLPSGALIVTQSPAWDGHKNGAMVDPTIVNGSSEPVQGFDDRVNGTSGNGPGMQVPPNSTVFFQSGARADLSLTANAGRAQSVICAKSAASVELGGMSNGIESMSILTIEPSIPARPKFRPPWAGTTKPTFTRADVNYALLPRLSPVGITQPDWTLAQYLRRPRIDMGGTVWGRTIFPSDSGGTGDTYPAYDALNIGSVALGCLLDIDEAHDLANRLIQYGIDMYYAALVNTNTFIANGGFGWGRLWPIVFAGIMLNHSGMKGAASLTTTYGGITVAKFGEVGDTFYGQATGGYPSGKPLWGRNHNSETPFANHDLRDLAGLVEPLEIPYPTGTCGAGSTTTAVVLSSPASTSDDAYNGYILRVNSQNRIITDYTGATRTATVAALSGAPAQNDPWEIRLGGTYQDMSNFVTGHALACRIMGAESTFGHNAFLDFIDRWVSESGLLNGNPANPTFADPIRPYGSLFVKQMWQGFR